MYSRWVNHNMYNCTFSCIVIRLDRLMSSYDVRHHCSIGVYFLFLLHEKRIRKTNKSKKETFALILIWFLLVHARVSFRTIRVMICERWSAIKWLKYMWIRNVFRRNWNECYKKKLHSSKIEGRKHIYKSEVIFFFIDFWLRKPMIFFCRFYFVAVHLTDKRQNAGRWWWWWWWWGKQ